MANLMNKKANILDLNAFFLAFLIVIGVPIVIPIILFFFRKKNAFMNVLFWLSIVFLILFGIVVIWRVF